MASENVFLFQTGAIKSLRLLSEPMLDGAGFYSKLVRLKDKDRCMRIFISVLVSIPNWCD